MTDPLAKSKTSAVLMSALAALSFSLVTAFLSILVPYLASGDIHTILENPESLSQPGSLAALIGIVVILFALLVSVGAAWIYRFFGEAYFGRRGALRWVLFGSLWAALRYVQTWFFPDNPILETIWEIVGVLGSFFVARWLVPLPKKVEAP